MPSPSKAVLTAIGANLAIVAAKCLAFAFTGSSGMLSEAIHTLVDTGNSSLLLLGLKRARRQPDELHPFGYGKEIYFWTLLVALFIFLVGGGFSIFEGVHRLQHPARIEHLFWNYSTLALSACLEVYSLWTGLQEFRHAEGVPASWRTIHASKNPSTFTVIIEDLAAISGLAIVFAATLLDQVLGWVLADGIASILVGVVLVVVAVVLMLETKALLVGEGMALSELQQIRRLSAAETGVVNVGYPITMYFGPENILLAMDVRFDQNLSRDEIERTIDRVEETVRAHYPSIRHIYLEAESLKAMSVFDPSVLPSDGNVAD